MEPPHSSESPAQSAPPPPPAGAPTIGVFVVAYNASTTIAQVLSRIKPETWRRITEVFVFDDSSGDDTCSVAARYCEDHRLDKVRVFRNQVNLGYGGNQKRGYRYALERGFDVVVLLHGDGQYAPEVMDDLIDPIARGEADAVLGSRMLAPGAALRGGMPLYKFVGNKVLTFVQNALLGRRMSEYHSGYRAYSVRALAVLPLLADSNGFHFDNEIIVQILEGGCRLKEVPIPTYYGKEICRVNGIAYAWNVLTTNLRYRLHKAGLLYARQFDLRHAHKYTFKPGYFSSHQQLIRLAGAARDGRPLDVLDVGCGPGFLAARLREAGHRVVGIDREDTAEVRRNCTRFLVGDADGPLPLAPSERFDVIIFADVLEHLRDPEGALIRARRHLRPGGRLLASTGNVAHAFIRLSLLAGLFTYTERGILDRTHCRLFTLATFRRLFRECGFRVLRRRVTPIPFENIFHGRGLLARLCCAANMALAAVWGSLFAYQTVLEAECDDTPSELLREQEILRPEYAEWGARRAA
ncbi:MAG TPA: bifunctional glycosyltransferase/class I SAM-dependent methyltransferase [Gemmataceae bacterium]|nr:bifunctional glycosyltransferase/class I SAM-dependent methyltransferase [Gemmataceae bacterium]